MKSNFIVIVLMAAMACTVWAKDEPVNLITNGGFEIPPVAEAKGFDAPGWELCAGEVLLVALTDTDARSGKQCLMLTAQGEGKRQQCVFTKLSVQQGAAYTFVVYVMNNKEERLDRGVHGLLSIEWLDARGLEIKRENSVGWNHRLSRLRWEKDEVEEAVAPFGAVDAKFVIHLVETGEEDSGSYLVDDVLIMKD